MLTIFWFGKQTFVKSSIACNNRQLLIFDLRYGKSLYAFGVYYICREFVKKIRATKKKGVFPKIQLDLWQGQPNALPCNVVMKVAKSSEIKIKSSLELALWQEGLQERVDQRKYPFVSEERAQHVIIRPADLFCRRCSLSWPCCSRLLHAMSQ